MSESIDKKDIEKIKEYIKNFKSLNHNQLKMVHLLSHKEKNEIIDTYNQILSIVQQLYEWRRR
jgi:hypothetical protein